MSLFLKTSLINYLKACGFNPAVGYSDKESDTWFKNGKQVNIVDYILNSGNDTCINVFNHEKKHMGKYTALSVLNESNGLLEYFLKT